MSGLWGFDIATANQAAGHELYPHNWNLMIRWSRASSNLMRDWLLMQFRRGLAADDQGTLFAAMQRQRAAGGLRVGQMPTPFAAAFYSATQSFYPRLTRPLTRSAVVLHIAAAKSDAAAEACRAFNAEIGTRPAVDTLQGSFDGPAPQHEPVQEGAKKSEVCVRRPGRAS